MGAFPGFAANRDAMLRVIRNHRRAAYGERRRLRRPRHPPGRARRRQLPRRPPRRRGQTSLGPCAGAGRAARLPQRPGLGDRAHRHDRPGDGLRHHRHRARLRAGEVQETGGRRLLQDHQPDRPAGACAPWATTRPRSAASLPTRSATARSHGAPAINHETLAARGFDAGDDRTGREIARHRLRHPLRLLALHPGRRRSVARCWASTTRRSPIPSSTCWRASASPGATSRRPTCMRAGRCRSRARPISSANISRCSIVRIPVDEMASAACLRRVTYA